MAFFCANLEGSLTKILKISGTTNFQIFLDALFFLPKSQIIDTHFTTVHPRRNTNEYGVKETEVDQSCFNDPVKWITLFKSSEL